MKWRDLKMPKLGKKKSEQKPGPMPETPTIETGAETEISQETQEKVEKLRQKYSKIRNYEGIYVPQSFTPGLFESECATLLFGIFDKLDQILEEMKKP